MIGRQKHRSCPCETPGAWALHIVARSALALGLRVCQSMTESKAGLWISEPDEPIWHHAVRRLGDGQFGAACGQTRSIARGRIWPVQIGEPGPLMDDRCHACWREMQQA